MSFSLIMATLGRTDEPRRFLDSLESQTFRDFELILADQNDDDRIAPMNVLDMPRARVMQ